jgi:hypothetical protein
MKKPADFLKTRVFQKVELFRWDIDKIDHTGHLLKIETSHFILFCS